MPDSGSRTYILTFMVVSLQICKSIRDVKQRVAPNSWSEHCRLCIQLWSCKYLIYFNSWLAFIFPLKHGWLLTLHNINDEKGYLCVQSQRTNSRDISCYDVIRNGVRKGKFEMIKSNFNSYSFDSSISEVPGEQHKTESIEESCTLMWRYYCSRLSTNNCYPMLVTSLCGLLVGWHRRTWSCARLISGLSTRSAEHCTGGCHSTTCRTSDIVTHLSVLAFAGITGRLPCVIWYRNVYFEGPCNSTVQCSSFFPQTPSIRYKHTSASRSPAPVSAQSVSTQRCCGPFSPPLDWNWHRLYQSDARCQSRDNAVCVHHQMKVQMKFQWPKPMGGYSSKQSLFFPILAIMRYFHVLYISSFFPPF